MQVSPETIYPSLYVQSRGALAQELNDRPRKRLGFQKPIELIEDLLLQ